jgi:hypothetical protein
VPLRKVPGILALGLLASLGAHAALYGNEHVMGGAYHGMLLTLALLGLACGLAGLAGLAWAGARHTADGTILATRLNDCLPGLPTLLCSTWVWYSLIEAVEPQHASVALPLAALILVAAAWLARGLARWAIGALAGAIFAILRAPFATRTPSWRRTRRSTPIAAPRPLLRRHFARPPPTLPAV